MEPILPHLIYPEQRAFIGGRSIIDNMMITQELLHDLQQALVHCCLMIIKFDIEQAYDRMSWSFFGVCSTKF